MSEFDRMLARAARELREAESARGVPPAAAEATARGIERLTLPGLLGLLFCSDRDVAPRGAALARSVAGELAAADPSLEPGELARWLTEAFPTLPAGAQQAEGLVGRAVGALARRSGVPLDAESARRVTALVTSRAFLGDAAHAAAALATSTRELPLAGLRDLLRSPTHAWELFGAIRRDLSGARLGATRLVMDLLDGRIETPPEPLVHTLASFFRWASARSIVALLRELLAEENESVRLAIFLYARTHGVPIEARDIDLLRDSVLDPENPRLGPALVAALERLHEQLDAEEIAGLLTSMGRR